MSTYIIRWFVWHMRNERIQINWRCNLSFILELKIYRVGLIICLVTGFYFVFYKTRHNKIFYQEIKDIGFCAACDNIVYGVAVCRDGHRIIKREELRDGCRWWQNEMWRQLARDVKISLGLLNVHLCFAVGRNIYDYGGKTVLAVRQFLLLHSPRGTVKRGSRTKVIIISWQRKAICRRILHCAIIFTDRNRTVIATLFSKRSKQF